MADSAIEAAGRWRDSHDKENTDNQTDSHDKSNSDNPVHTETTEKTNSDNVTTSTTNNNVIPDVPVKIKEVIE